MQQDKIEQARHLYFAQAKTQKEIAQMLNICEKTIYNWIRRFSWDKMREAARKAPALISENLCSQIVELQNSIGRREPGLRYATAEESLIMQRLITMLDKMKRYVGLSMNMQIIGNFRNWASTRDKSFARDLGLYSGLFLQGYAQNGYYPYELEFGMDKINPFDPYYKEEPIDCHPEPAEGHPEPAEGPTPEKKDVVMSAPNTDLQGHPGLAEDPEPAEELTNDGAQGVSRKMSSQACLGPVNQPTEQAQDIDNQSTYNTETHLPAPVKTGKTPAIPDPTDEFPTRKWTNLEATVEPSKKLTDSNDLNQPQ